MLSRNILSIVARYRVPHIMYMFELEHNTREIENRLSIYGGVYQKDALITHASNGHWVYTIHYRKEHSRISNLGKLTSYYFNYYTGKVHELFNS